MKTLDMPQGNHPAETTLSVSLLVPLDKSIMFLYTDKAINPLSEAYQNAHNEMLLKNRLGNRPALKTPRDG
jgi:hypothetical protein